MVPVRIVCGDHFISTRLIAGTHPTANLAMTRTMYPSVNEHVMCPGFPRYTSLQNRNIFQRTPELYRRDIRSESSGYLQLSPCVVLFVVVIHIRFRSECGLHSEIPSLRSVIETIGI